MAKLCPMPRIDIDLAELAAFGRQWSVKQSLSRTKPYSSSQLGYLFDTAVGASLSTMLGGIPIIKPNARALVAAQTDCVEVGPVRIVGGVRPQNFDVGYRPDGVRFAFDSKTLNDIKSVGKNWQNMINDVATEATTVHSRFPYAVVGFMVIVPGQCISLSRRSTMIETMERLARRDGVEDPLYMAEAISFVLWNPEDGTISKTVPRPESPLRIERFSSFVEAAYVNRYKGLPPHAVAEEEDEGDDDPDEGSQEGDGPDAGLETAIPGSSGD